MLVDELKKNYELYNRELTKEETEELYGNVLENIEDRMKAHKAVNTWKLCHVDVKGDIAKLPMLVNGMPKCHFDSIVNYFRSEGLEVELVKRDLIFKW